MIIAVDGVSASGKGTLSKELAKKFQLNFLDTGKIYRLVAYKTIEKYGIDYNINDAISVAKYIDITEIQNLNLTNDKIAKASSYLAKNQIIRSLLIDVQRNFANEYKKVILDGRDIGTVILPNADIKFFVTADVEVRAKRRFAELTNQKLDVSYNQIMLDLQHRDKQDSKRKHAPLKVAEDAIIVDTSNMSILDMVNYCSKYIEK